MGSRGCGRIGRAASLAVVTILIRRLAARAGTLDEAIGQEHRLDRIVGLSDLTPGDVAGIPQPLERAMPVIGIGASRQQPPVASLRLFLVVQVAFAAAVGVLESFRARKKLARNPQFIVTLAAIAIVGFLLALLMHSNLIPG